MKKNLLKIFVFFIALVLIAGGANFYFWIVDKVRINDGHCIKCNVVLISADSLRADHMSLYGYGRPTTPNIEAWGKKSLVFSQFFSSAYLTPISEASIHTGLYPEINGIIGFRRHYALNVKPLAQILKENGYQTIAHGDSPEFRAFSSLKESFSRGFDNFFMQRRLDPTHASRGVKWNEVKTKIAATKGPFFLWVPLGSAHSPFGFDLPLKFTSKEYKGVFKKLPFLGNLEIYYDKFLYELTPERRFHFITSNNVKYDPVYLFDKEALKLSTKWPLAIVDNDLKYINDRYDDGVAHIDNEFLKLQEMLKATGHDKDTIIIFESEHGESLGEHKYIAHYDIYDTTVHVPLVISSPAIKGGQRIDFPISGVDVLPTLLNHLNIKFDDYPLNGKNFLEKGKVQKIREEVFITRIPLWETILKLPNNPNTIFGKLRELDDQNPNRDYAIRNNSWKLIHRLSRKIENEFSVIRYVTGRAPERKEFELYDLKNDPGETRALELSASPEGQKLKGTLLKFEAEVLERNQKSRISREVEDYN